MLNVKNREYTELIYRGVITVNQKWHDLKENEIFMFIVRTAFYFIVLAMLVYLYSFRGISNGTFIYNEF